MAIIFQTKMVNPKYEGYGPLDYYSAFSIFWAGVTVGLANLVCGYNTLPIRSFSLDIYSHLLFASIVFVSVFVEVVARLPMRRIQICLCEF